MKANYGVITARYQPVHRGHLVPIKAALERCEELIIGIAFPNPANTYQAHPTNPRVTDPRNNPFRYFERLIMLQKALKGEVESDKVHIVPYESGTLLPDWPSHSYFPPNCTWYFYITSDWDVKKMEATKNRHRNVEVLGENRESRIHGSDIRDLIAEYNDRWRSLVPEPVAEYIVGIGGVQRIQHLYEKSVIK